MWGYVRVTYLSFWGIPFAVPVPVIELSPQAPSESAPSCSGMQSAVCVRCIHSAQLSYTVLRISSNPHEGIRRL